MTTWHLGQASYTLVIAFEAVGCALSIFPGSSVKSEFKHPAFSPLFSLARLVVEAHNSATYLLEDVSDEVREHRALVWQYAAERGRLQILRNAEVTSPETDRLVALVGGLEEQVDNHPLTAQVDVEQLKRIKKGRSDRVLPIERVREMNGASKAFTLSTYSYLSKYAHVTAFSVRQIDAHGANPDTIPSGMGVVVQMLLAYYSLLLRSISQAFGATNIPTNARSIIARWCEEAESFGNDEE